MARYQDAIRWIVENDDVHWLDEDPSSADGMECPSAARADLLKVRAQAEASITKRQPVPKNLKLSPAQRAMLRNAQAGRSLLDGLKGRSEHGGAAPLGPFRACCSAACWSNLVGSPTKATGS